MSLAKDSDDSSDSSNSGESSSESDSDAEQDEKITSSTQTAPAEGLLPSCCVGIDC